MGRRPSEGTMTDAPLILWFRRDLRLDDHPMLAAAAATGRPLIPVFVLDDPVLALGAAARWRLGLALEAFADRLEEAGSRLILRRGPALPVLLELAAQTGAAGVRWTRAYDPESRGRDTAVKAGLRESGLEAVSHPGHLLAEPWELATGAGGPYRVFTPFWRALSARNAPPPLPPPATLPPPAEWPDGERLADWRLGAGMRRGAAVAAPWQAAGEPAARRRLDRFLTEGIDGYGTGRDALDRPGTSGLSQNLTFGEIGVRRVWHAAGMAGQRGAKGAAAFRRELGWRDFAWHLLYHFPDLSTGNWRPEWDGFAWKPDNPAAERWRRGMTGEPLVDAAMREMYVTGTMHNRARMIAASYLTKHLLTDWRVGLAWFADCLTDWDPASNALGWQWVAGSGPDAAPYFRIFSPAAQAGRFDPQGAYRRRWIAELSPDPPATARAFFDAVPESWGLDPAQPYPAPVVGLAEGRERALAAYARAKGLSAEAK